MQKHRKHDKIQPMRYVLTLCFLMLGLSAPPRPDPEIDDIDEVLIQYVRPLLIAESGNSHYNRRGKVKKSHKGAIGKWQVMPDTSDFYWMKVGGYDTPACLYDEITNQIIGYWYLRYCFKAADGDLALTFSFYNRGHNTKQLASVSYLKKIIPECFDD